MKNDIKKEIEEEKQLQLVTFSLDNEEYALNIFEVREINKMIEVTKVPNTPHYVEGIVNLRGTIVPVINLRKKLNLLQAENKDNSEIIVVEYQDNLIGLVVDSVNRVMNISTSIISKTPDSIRNQYSDVDCSVANLDDRLLILIDIDSLLKSEELSELANVS